MRVNFQSQLRDLNEELQRMGRLVETAIAKAVNALVERNVGAAEAVVQGDRHINEAYARIMRLCLDLLALQQPMAGDLRHIASTMKVITDLERMADHAVDIARVVVRLGGQEHIKPLVDIPAMAAIAQAMVGDALAAFVGRDKERALAMIEKDHQVDRLYKTVIQDLQALMEQRSDAAAQGVQLLFVSHALERIGDHATNLGEWLIYLETGNRTEMNT